MPQKLPPTRRRLKQNNQAGALLVRDERRLPHVSPCKCTDTQRLQLLLLQLHVY